MTEAQYNAFKQRKWKQTDVPCLLVNGGKETVSERSWRQILETIFPTSYADEASEPCDGSSIVGQFDVGIRNVITSSEARPSVVMGELITQFKGPPRIDTTPRAALPPIPTSFTTADDTSNDLWTDQQTQPSTLMNSHSGIDGQEDALSYGAGEPADQDNFARPPSDGFQEQLGFDHLTGTGGGAADIEGQDLFDLNWYLEVCDQKDDLGGKQA
ncbi:hypothetical protein FHETE_1852 [Fusarium heterosporum]|uniref:Uncharacterized protein n=1 Tax=Fusarium heterosporum TaxID=42747 RepID=A0A8H5TXK0_FUSHE|nr:hypothetical protein FHETE_1852 [Fusarium heterosporum]